MVTIAECLQKNARILKDSCDTPLLDASVMLSHLLNKDRLYLNIHKNDCVADEILHKFEEMCLRRSKGEPIAYITGTKEFMSLEFEVNENVLIPRPDTELIAEYICNKYKNTKPDIIDICTGSGAIACSLAYYIPDSRVYAVDISEKALEIAKKNATKNSVGQNTSFFIADALAPIQTDIKFDVAVSNPPYIESEVIPTLMCDVRDFEPHLALDGGADGLIFYRKIVDNIDSILKPGGELVFEIGYNQAESVCALMKPKFSGVSVYCDAAGADRMVCGQLE